MNLLGTAKMRIARIPFFWMLIGSVLSIGPTAFAQENRENREKSEKSEISTAQKETGETKQNPRRHGFDKKNRTRRIIAKKAPRRSSAQALPQKVVPNSEPQPIILGVPAMGNSVFKAPDIVVAPETSRSFQLGVEMQMSGYSPTHYNPVSNFQSNSSFKAQSMPMISVRATGPSHLFNSDGLNWFAGFSYLNMARTGSTTVVNSLIQEREDASVMGLNLGLQQEFYVSYLGSFRPFVEVGTFAMRVQSQASAFDDGINDNFYGATERLGFNARFNSLRASIGVEALNQFKGGEVNGAGLFFGLGASL